MKKGNKAAYTLGIILGVLVIIYMSLILLHSLGSIPTYNKLDTGPDLISSSGATTSVCCVLFLTPLFTVDVMKIFGMQFSRLVV